MNFFRRKRQDVSEFDRKVVEGVPSVFTGADTTIGEMREMAIEHRDVSYLTPAEKGLAVCLVAVIEMYERDFNGQAEGSRGQS